MLCRMAGPRPSRPSTRMPTRRRWSTFTGSSARSRRTSTCSPTRGRARRSRSIPRPRRSPGSPTSSRADWTLKLIVSTPRPLGPHRRQRRGRRAHRRRHRGPPARPRPADRPAPCMGAVRDPAVGAGRRARRGRRGPVRRDPASRVLHTPGHTEGRSACSTRDEGLLFSGDTLFAGGWGRVDLPGGDSSAMVPRSAGC